MITYLEQVKIRTCIFLNIYKVYIHSISSNNPPPPRVVNKILSSPPRLNVFIEYLSHFDNQPTIIIRLSKDVIFSENNRSGYYSSIHGIRDINYTGFSTDTPKPMILYYIYELLPKFS